MDPAAKKVSIAIIVILVGVIGVFWYDGEKKSVPAELKATATSTNFDLRAYAAGRATLEEITGSRLDEIVSSGTTSDTQKPTSAVQYKASNLIVSNYTATTALRAYGLAVAAALKGFNTDRENELVTMLTALENKDALRAQELSAIAVANKQIVATLLKITVPRSAIDIHLELINTLSQNSARLADMSLILDNPYLALTAANAFRVEKLNFYKAIDHLNAFFLDNKIVFKAEEGGIIFMNI